MHTRSRKGRSSSDIQKRQTCDGHCVRRTCRSARTRVRAFIRYRIPATRYTVAASFPLTEGEIVADNPSIRGDGDRKRINVDQDYEVRYWTERLGVSADDLRQAVKNVGPMADAVEQHLRGRNAKGRTAT